MLTPVECTSTGIYLKRDDLYEVNGQRGGKVRTCWALSVDAAGLITAGSRHSPQVAIVAAVAQARGIPARVHVPAGPETPEVVAAARLGADVVRHRPGYNSVIIARARDDARRAAIDGWAEIPFGMECQEAVCQTARQTDNIPWSAVRRIVVPVGSGMSLAGILRGMSEHGVLGMIPVLGIRVGADPSRRLDTYAPAGWRESVSLVDAQQRYGDRVEACVDDVALDPVYEGKALPFLRDGDLFWIVGHRG